MPVSEKPFSDVPWLYRITPFSLRRLSGLSQGPLYALTSPATSKVPSPSLVDVTPRPLR